VVLDAEGLTTSQMQAIATEFNYSETTFVLPPQHVGRPSLILGRTEKRDGLVAAVHIAGHAVPVMRGLLHVPPSSIQGI
jgi:predicted PhzF superfamily epimerase YddE/YHI9